MQLIKSTVLCTALAVAACSESNNPPLVNVVDEQNTNGSTVNPTDGTNTNIPEVNVIEPTDNAPGVGSIIISTEPAIELEPLPDITFAEAPIITDGESAPTDTSLEAVVDEPVEEPIAASVDGGTTGDADADADVLATSPVSESTSIAIEETVRPQPEFQAGSLTAADYDDQLNPHLYQNYASAYLQRVGGRLDVPYLDLSNRIALHVTDEQGRRYGGAHIDIINTNGQVLNLEVPSSGVTYIYTDLDNLSGQFTIRATGEFGTAIEEVIDLAQLDSGRIDIAIPETTFPPEVIQDATILDIMFVIDTTGSMGDELRYLQTELNSIINAIPNHIQLNLGLTFYRDIGDDYVVRAHDFNNDITSVQRTLNDETFGGGGDYPEAMDQALQQAMNANWQQDSHKVLFLIADAPPHDDKMRATWEAAERARDMNIHIVPVAASGVAEDAEYLMRSIAAFTNSRYVFLTDDSGFGNPHAEPDVDCYVVTQLNNLMIRVINSLVAGVRQEPTSNDIIRQVGNYNQGVCDPQEFILQ